jgi:hypothetical protein
MPFNIDDFMFRVHAINLTYSRHKESALTPLVSCLERLAPTFNSAAARETIQAVYCNIAYETQQKYKDAIDYLKRCLNGALVDALPIFPKMQFLDFGVNLLPTYQGLRDYPVRFHHLFRLTWKSSNGHAPSLKPVRTREYFQYETDPTAPPFNDVVIPPRDIKFAQGDNPAYWDKYPYLYNDDDHSFGNPALNVAQPAQVGQVVGKQRYEYRTNGNDWRVIRNAEYTVTRGVRERKGQRTFYFNKERNLPPNEFHFEVVYPIERLTVRIPVLDVRTVPPFSFCDKEHRDIRKYGRVISLG